jgi:hypothetical protein
MYIRARDLALSDVGVRMVGTTLSTRCREERYLKTSILNWCLVGGIQGVVDDDLQGGTGVV